jgi:hypothetical protein
MTVERLTLSLLVAAVLLRVTGLDALDVDP